MDPVPSHKNRLTCYLIFLSLMGNIAKIVFLQGGKPKQLIYSVCYVQ
jgi:hypothetical protein